MAEIKPARYPNYYAEELDAIIIFEGLLNRKIVVPHLNKLDKIPNTDGYLEIVDEGAYPLGRVEVQVKKIPDGDTTYQCPVELVAYSQTIGIPFLLVCVDVGNKKAYFKHLHSLMPEFKSDQGSFVIKFDPNVSSVSNETQYVRQWLIIIQDYNKRILDFPRISQIASQLDVSHISKVDFIYFQEFIDHLNRLLDSIFPIVKEQFFKGVWKMGVGVSSADAAQVAFQLYVILFGETAPLVSGIPTPPNKPAAVPDNVISWHLQGQDGKTVQFNWRSRAALKTPKAEAEDFVFNHLIEMLRAKSLPLYGKRLATEYLFWFVDNCGASIGVDESDRLDVAKLNYGISVYLSAWASLAMPRYAGEIHRLNKGNAEAVAHALMSPPFESIARMGLVKKEEVLQLIQSGKTLRNVRIRFWEASPQLLMNAVDFLIGENQEYIDRPYKQKSDFRGSWVWCGYSAETFRHNVQSIYIDSLSEYKLFIERNQIPLKKSVYLNNSNAFIYAADFEKWASAKGGGDYPVLNVYVVKNEDNKLPKLTLVDSRQAKEFIAEKDRLKICGLEREIISSGWFMAKDLFESQPMLNRIYSMLKQDLENEYGHRFS